MLENTAIICNTYLDAINKVIKRPMVAIGGSYNINEFKKETAPLFKQQYLNLLIFDVSVIKDDVLEALCYLKTNLDSNVRIIVLYPNLDDEKIYRQILAYGIYDVIDTKIDKDTMSDEDINKLIISELNWMINEPVRFNKVKDKLKIDIPVVNEIKAEETPKALKETNKKRLVGFFEDDDASFKTIRSSGRYNIIGICKGSSFDEKSDDISYADVIVMDEPSEEFVRYIKSLSEVNEKKPLIIVGIKDQNKSQYIGVDGVRCFIYDGTAEHFARQVSIVYHERGDTLKTNDHAIYAFRSVKGGIGNTTLTMLAATSYARKNKGQRVVVVDYSLRAGDIAERSGIDKPDPNLYECVADFLKAKKEHIDIDLLKNKIKDYCHYDPKHMIYVLPTAYGDIYRYTNYLYPSNEIADIYRFILEALKEMYDAVFVDIGRGSDYLCEIVTSLCSTMFISTSAKLSGVSHMLGTINELKEDDKGYETVIVVNKLDAKHNENEYENLKIIKDHVKGSKLIELPFDKKLDDEVLEMDVYASKKYMKAVDAMWDKMSGIEPKRGILWRK